MSHFTVLVIGDNIEEQLQPFHEFECTGIDDQYVQDIDITAEVQEDIDEHGLEKGVEYSYGLSAVSNESELEKDGEHKYGYAIVKDGKLIRAVRRTNPNKKWDWWVLGGRWSGLLKLKAGASGKTGRPGLMGSNFAKGADRADQARKCDIDFEGMRAQAGDKASALWEKARVLTGGKTWEAWPSVRARFEKIDDARAYYREQTAIKSLMEGDQDTFGWDIDDSLAGSREAFVQAARDRACTTFAVLKDGQWFEKGRMGWWACVSDEKDQNDWNRQFSELIDSLQDDALLSIVDCHI